MRLLSDEALAVRVAAGDDRAFAELARRYQPLIGRVTRRPPPGVPAEDVRQEALLGLLEACRITDGERRFAGIAALRVQWRVNAVRRAAMARKQLILTDAAHASDDRDAPLARLAAPAHTDPARIVELREQLRTRLSDRARRQRRRARAPRGDLRRRYTDEQIRRAVELVARGSSIRAAATAVGAREGAVHEWLRNPCHGARASHELAARRGAAPGGDLRRRYSDEQINRAVTMVANGSNITTAAAAVGATLPTALRWLRKAA